MADRRVKVNLELDAKGYSDGAKQASKATQDLQRAVLDAEKAASQSGQKVSDAYRKQQDAAGKLRVAEEQLKKARDSGDAVKLAAAEERVESAKRNNDEATRRLTSAEEAHAPASDRAAAAQANLAAETDKAASASEKLGQFIDDNRQDMQTAGAALAGVAAGVGALGAAVAHTGIEYNTLQQTSGAALKTLMGDASAAADQMDRLDEFASTSPFSKAVFIEAQQQLLAFGVEAGRVVPILDSIQNAVAATGGSNEDISELTRILAQVTATGKITAETLNQLGTRGIDAATIIGEQMGKSGAAIRDEITAGTLDADAAIQALTDGMSERFDGAAAGVKDTFEGAMDRVKAAWRDVSAELMTGLVDPDGGGMLIDLANQAADVIRAFQDLPDSVKNGVAALGGLAGVAAGGAGALLLLAPAAADTYRAFRDLRTALPGLVAQFPKLTRAAKVAGGAAALGGLVLLVGKIATEMMPAVASVEEMTSALNELRDAGDASRLNEALTFDMGMKGELEGIADTLDHLNTSFLENPFRGVLDIFGAAGTFTKARESLEQLDQTLASMEVEPAADAMNSLRVEAEAAGNMDLSSWSSMQEKFPEYTAAIQDWANQAGVSTDAADLFQYAVGNIPPELQAVIDGADPAAAGVDGVGDAMGAAADDAADLVAELDATIEALFELGRQNRSEAEAQGAFSQAVRDANDALAENGRNFDVTTEKGMANRQALHDVATEMETLVEAQARGGATSEELAGSMQAAYDEVLRLTGGSEELTREILGIPTDVDIETYMDDTAREMAISTAGEIEALPGYVPIEIAISENGTAGQVQERINGVTGKTEYVFVTEDGTTTTVQRKIMEIDGKTEYVWVDDDGTVYNTQAEINSIEGKDVAIRAVASTYDAQAQLDQLSRPRSAIIRAEIRNQGQARFAEGGVVGSLPMFSNGGRLPSYGKGTDTILGVGSNGTPTAWVDDGEFVTRRSSTQKYYGLLDRINRDDPSVRHLAGYAGGGMVGREWSASSAASIDYDRLASVLRGGGAVDNRSYTFPVQQGATINDAVNVLRHETRRMDRV